MIDDIKNAATKLRIYTTMNEITFGVPLKGTYVNGRIQLKDSGLNITNS